MTQIWKDKDMKTNISQCDLYLVEFNLHIED